MRMLALTPTIRSWEGKRQEGRGRYRDEEKGHTVIMRELAPIGRLAPIGEKAPGCDKKHNLETFNRVFAPPSERSHPGAISPT